ncbi:MOSC domain-containing protein [Aureobasidium pullulans]|uniref:MOSC domain-containing protein n=1 Tax=Aureobasidium pullulans TaxID=5580 RepID=A0A4S8VGK3_AURPU|nr:MOSC domain-containing protein [Aureobasidium pullulans]
MPSIDLTPIPVPSPTTLQEISTSKLKKSGTVLSGIDKRPIQGSLYVSSMGLTDDEHDLTFHGGIDKAIHQYDHSHYPFWQPLYPEAATRFVAGGFGENLVVEELNEDNICVGDLVRIGPKDSTLTGGDNGCVLEVSLPRQPCFKLNQRFGVKNLAPKTHAENKTGWYYRVKEQGYISAGMEIRVIHRCEPRWSIARLHHYVHRDKVDLEISKELVAIDVLGDECKDVFKKRLQDAETKAAQRNQTWTDYRVHAKKMETPRIVRLDLQACNIDGPKNTTIPVGSYALLKLPNGLKRAYSIVTVNTSLFTLGIALDDNSRGGSSYIHTTLNPGAIIQVGDINRSIKSNGMASHHIFITFELHYAVRSADEVAFTSLMSGFKNVIHIYDKSKNERMSIPQILHNRIWNSHVFTCGPDRMISAVVSAAKDSGMADDEIYYENFSTDTTGDPFTASVITGAKTTSLEVAADKTLLEVMREAGLEVASSCETGSCGTCRIGVKRGKVLHKGTGLSTEEQEKEMLCCVSRGQGHIDVELLD